MNNLIDLHKVFDWNYLTVDTTSQFKYDKVILFIIIACALSLIPLFFLSRKKITKVRPTRMVFRYLLTTIFLIDLYGFLVYFSRIQLLPLFSLRIMLLIWVILNLLAILFFTYYLIFRYRNNVKKYFKLQEKQKYFPKRNG